MSEETQTAEALESETAELRKALEVEAVQIGLKVGKRWSNEKLIGEIGRKNIEAAQQKAVTQARAEIKEASATEKVSARVLPMGDGKISRGIHIPGKGDLFFRTGDTINTERQLAENLQARGLVEIQHVAA